MADRDTRLEWAREARDLAYAPHSDFLVGAALEAEDGSIHAGGWERRPVRAECVPSAMSWPWWLDAGDSGRSC
jgi:hypothetical protein